MDTDEYVEIEMQKPFKLFPYCFVPIALSTSPPI